MSKPEDDMLDELRDLFPEQPPPQSKTFGTLLKELRDSGRAVTTTSLRTELAALVVSGKWCKGRVGNKTHYWPVKSE